MINAILLQLFAEEAAPEDGARTQGADASVRDAADTGAPRGSAQPSAAPPEGKPEGKPTENAVPEEKQTQETPPEGKQTQETPPEGKPTGTPPADAGSSAGLLAGVAAALEAKRRNDGLKRIVAAWEESASALREIYPGFDLKREARENPEFARLLQAGVSVRRAYEAANLETILGEAMRYAVRTAGKKTAESMRSQSGRVQENSVLDRAPSLTRKDVDSLTGADILRILDEVSRGAKISF